MRPLHVVQRFIGLSYLHVLDVQSNRSWTHLLSQNQRSLSKPFQANFFFFSWITIYSLHLPICTNTESFDLLSLWLMVSGFFPCSSLLDTAMTACPPNVWSYCLSHLGFVWEFSSHLQWYFRLIPFWDNESAGHTSLAKSSYINVQKHWLPIIVYAHGHPQVTQISQIKPPLFFKKYY